MGRSFVWDATCGDTVAPSHVSSIPYCAGAAAAGAESLRRRKYTNLIGNYIFEPYEEKTLGSWGPNACIFYKDLMKRLLDVSRNQKDGHFLAERLSIAVQCGNAASLLGMMPVDRDAVDLL